ncbi:hypothetical protein [Aliidiomarina quisquiliarum]|uniref:hypothetical protein n=1 Tax=Aliidiomarina quisquiliarum TaxID=2938947 RepID=UPI00208E25DC|nr:hypothetical protein [Aliidiomarina quisquiliarum]MCO4319994.1 hypothetical protein [Aliidiomarina quisquiliarum]
MKTLTIEIDNEANIRFTGELIGCASSSPNQAMGSSYSGKVGRWTELELYKTEGGKFICRQIGRTQWQGERDRFSGKVCESLGEVKDFFGYRWLAKELYKNTGIDASTTVGKGYQSFYLSPIEIEAARYYVTFGCPKLVGVPEFSEINSDLGEPVTYVDGTDFTQEEYAKLEMGEDSVEKLSELIAKLIQDDSYDGERLKNILF